MRSGVREIWVESLWSPGKGDTARVVERREHSKIARAGKPFNPQVSVWQGWAAPGSYNYRFAGGLCDGEPYYIWFKWGSIFAARRLLLFARS